jgi:DNA-binding transcriptional LysR family regulator
VAIADAALFTDLIASGKVVKPFGLEVDSGNAYFLTYPPQRREQRSIRLFEEWMLGVLRG